MENTIASRALTPLETLEYLVESLINKHWPYVNRKVFGKIEVEN